MLRSAGSSQRLFLFLVVVVVVIVPLSASAPLRSPSSDNMDYPEAPQVVGMDKCSGPERRTNGFGAIGNGSTPGAVYAPATDVGSR